MSFAIFRIQHVDRCAVLENLHMWLSEKYGRMGHLTVDGCSVEYVYKLVCQFAWAVAHRIVWPCSDDIQIDKMLVYGILCFPAYLSLSAKLLGTHFVSIQ